MCILKTISNFQWLLKKHGIMMNKLPHDEHIWGSIKRKIKAIC